MIRETEQMLEKVTGFAGCSLMPNSGAAGEYTALMVYVNIIFPVEKVTGR